LRPCDTCKVVRSDKPTVLIVSENGERGTFAPFILSIRSIYHQPAIASAARHNAVSCVRCVQCGIHLSRELSGECPEVQRLSARHARTCAPHEAVCVPLRCVHGECRAACAMVSLAVDHLFPENADIVDLVLRHYYHGARGWEKARFDAEIWSVQYGPAGDVIAAGAGDGRIHLICAQTGAKFLCLNGHR
jgi:hypothetical protein